MGKAPGECPAALHAYTERQGCRFFHACCMIFVSSSCFSFVPGMLLMIFLPRLPTPIPHTRYMVRNTRYPKNTKFTKCKNQSPRTKQTQHTKLKLQNIPLNTFETYKAHKNTTLAKHTRHAWCILCASYTIHTNHTDHTKKHDIPPNTASAH